MDLSRLYHIPLQLPDYMIQRRLQQLVDNRDPWATLDDTMVDCSYEMSHNFHVHTYIEFQGMQCAAGVGGHHMAVHLLVGMPSWKDEVMENEQRALAVVHTHIEDESYVRRPGTL
jgi:hypothetical protein